MKKKRPNSSTRKPLGAESAQRAAADEQRSPAALRRRLPNARKPFYRALPIWFQATALFCLACAPLVCSAWAGATCKGVHPRVGAWLHEATAHFLYFLMPLPVLVLGIRFLCRFFPERERKTEAADHWYRLGIVAVVLSAILMVFTWLSEQVQQVRIAAPRSTQAAVPAPQAEDAVNNPRAGQIMREG
jgi:hypothetical protein